MTITSETNEAASWAALLREAVEQPGMILEAYSSFHDCSIGNCLLAYLQCHARGISPGPVATYKRWQELGRQVRKGKKAPTLYMPVTRKNTKKVRENERDTEMEEGTFYTFFIDRARWFVLAKPKATISSSTSSGMEQRPGPSRARDHGGAFRGCQRKRSGLLRTGRQDRNQCPWSTRRRR